MGITVSEELAESSLARTSMEEVEGLQNVLDGLNGFTRYVGMSLGLFTEGLLSK